MATWLKNSGDLPIKLTNSRLIQLTKKLASDIRILIKKLINLI
jgi:hypothetical protein